MKRTKTLGQSSVTLPFHPETDGAVQTAPRVDTHGLPLQPKLPFMARWRLFHVCDLVPTRHLCRNTNKQLTELETHKFLWHLAKATEDLGQIGLSSRLKHPYC